MKRKAAEDRMKVRAEIFLAVFLFGVLPVLLFSMYKISVRDASELQAKAIAQQTRDMLISPARGTIYDANKLPLAISATVQTIVISPAEIKDIKDSRGDLVMTEQEAAELIARGLSDILGVSYNSVYEKTQNRKSYYEVVARKVDKGVSDAVREFKTEHRLAGIKLFEDTKRFYPYGSLASNVIGFTNFDNAGEYGIERKFEEVLKGVVGRVITAKNNKGSEMPFYFEQYFDAQDGKSLVLTIDYGAQQILEKHLEIALEENGCLEGTRGVIMNVKTGEILAMAQKGDYDLNDPRTIADEEKRALLDAAPDEEKSALQLKLMYEQWANKSIQEAYEPGSVFKILTAAIALEEGLVNESSEFYCSGSTTIGGTTVSCWKRGGHGSQTFGKAIENSCNCAFMELGRRIGHEKFYEYMKAFGLFDKTNVDLQGESTPVEGVHYQKYERFSDPNSAAALNLAVYSFGQTFKITPLQMLTAVCAVVNGGNLVQPYVVKAYADSSGNITEEFGPKIVRQVISAKTSEQMRVLLENVVTTGTGKNAYVPGYRVGGKTGTSEKRDKTYHHLQETGEDKNFYIASFLGVAPCDDPQYAVLILLDEPTGALHQGGQIAAPVVGRIMADLLPYLNVNPVYSNEDVKSMQTEVPNTIGTGRSYGEQVMKEAGFKTVKIVGDGEKITGQYPRSASKIPSSATIILYCGEPKDESLITVPDLTGKSFDEALSALGRLGLYLSPGGAIGASTGETLTAQRQSPSTGDRVTFGSVIHVEFYGKNDLGE